MGNLTTLVLTIGSHIAPLLPPPDGVSVAIEPVVYNQIPPHPNLYIVPAAVSGDGDGVAAMERFAGSIGSQVSSLSDYDGNADYSAYYRKIKGAPLLAVPVISMGGLLASIPPHVTLYALKTDMQGHDFSALSSVGPRLRVAHWILSETYLKGTNLYKLQTGNDFCDQWLPHMTRMGYELHALRGAFGVRGRPYLAMNTSQAEDFCAQHQDEPPTTAAPPPPPHGLRHREANAVWRLNTTTRKAPHLVNWRLDH